MADDGEPTGALEDQMPINAEDNLTHYVTDAGPSDLENADDFDEDYDPEGADELDQYDDDDDLVEHGEAAGSDEDGDESELVVLDPDHVRTFLKPFSFSACPWTECLVAIDDTLSRGASNDATKAAGASEHR